LIDCVDHDCCDPVALMECREHLSQTRTALSQPEPEGLTTAELDALWLATWSDETQQYDVAAFARAVIAADRARTTLAQPEPEVPTVMQILALSDEIGAEELGTIDLVRRALARWAHPAIEPVPMTERPWKREGWCDAEGRCWFLIKGSSLLKPCWVLGEPGEGILTHSFSLPHHALPLPTPTP
jgi:hypothetical protein